MSSYLIFLIMFHSKNLLFHWMTENFSFLIYFCVCLQHPLMQPQRNFSEILRLVKELQAQVYIGNDSIPKYCLTYFLSSSKWMLSQNLHVFLNQSYIKADVLLFHVCTFPFLHISIYVCDFLPYLSAIIYVKSLACKKKWLSHYRAVLLRAYCDIKSPSVVFFSWPCEMMCIF